MSQKISKQHSLTGTKLQDANAQPLMTKLRTWVDILHLEEEVLDALIPKGRPHDFESQLWDYKEKLPALSERPTPEERKQHTAELGDIMKDVIAFYNAYGGYIVFGVADKGNQKIRGCSGTFDCGDFNKRLESFTGTSVECVFRMTPISDASSTLQQIGLLLVPRRPTGATPVRFKKKGPEKANGTRSFGEETYVRVRDECRPATAMSEDWLFLHSDRSPPDASIVYKKPKVFSALPARDPDLIEFVGREEALSIARKWLSDPRSPVRLVTGIGGLGKTTLAYRFAEEVVASGAGDVEWVIWLTAKRKTYSALRGQLVEAGRVDFVGLHELYNAILKALSYELPPEAEEPSVDDLADRVVDAMCSYTCLLIVDDIDSLSPDEQKEAVAALNGIALRTVGREIACSRVLMTSRIDQGLAPTSVIKISGLEKDDFKKYVANLCRMFGVGPVVDNYFPALYAATSGSPLFAASIIRLIYLGENLNSVIETWQGQDGEEVRRFAFEREIARLDSLQGRLLYAVLLLGETSINDLASILEVTPRVIRDRVSELQAYHLISTATKESGDAVIFAPSDLSVVTELLRKHLGTQAVMVEQSCARAQERSNANNRTIGAGIRRVVASWGLDRPDEALSIAQELKDKFKKNGDVANIFGVALIRVVPKRLREADHEFDEARRLGCSRPELIADSIAVKTELRDWQGLLDMVAPIWSNESARDLPLQAYTRACSELINIAKGRGDYGRVVELCIGGVEKISKKFSRSRIEKWQFDELSDVRFRFAHEYISALVRLNPRPGDKLAIFEGVWRLAEFEVVLIELVRTGLLSLQSWWKDVEERPFVDVAACGILNRQLSRLERLQRQLSEYGRKFDDLDRVRLDLAHRGAKLSP